MDNSQRIVSDQEEHYLYPEGPPYEGYPVPLTFNDLTEGQEFLFEGMLGYVSGKCIKDGDGYFRESEKEERYQSRPEALVFVKLERSNVMNVPTDE
jgi:hypothetical protein